MSKRFPGRRLSPVRLTVLVAIVGTLVASTVVGWNRLEDVRAAANGGSWFAGYVDATATPFYPFEQPASEQGKSVVLSFIVADPAEDCRPSWGAAYSLDEAQSELDLDRRIARLIQDGGEVAVSFGGLINNELARTCTDVRQLTSAYRAVVERYNLTTIDLDIEGEDLADSEAAARRAEAVAALQEERRADGKPLNVWLTLPVAPSGLTLQGTDAVTTMLEGGVDLAGVNIMTMDYGGSREPGVSQLDASVAAARATHAQLGILYDRAGTSLGPQTLWKKIGLTPMIGQNDVPAEVFDLEAAAAFNAFALETGVGRMSMWSLNRDATCSDNYGNAKIVSDSCSGIEQDGTLFADVLGAGFEGRAATLNSAPTTDEPTPELVVDDPETSPYPIWSEEATYVLDDRVVWRGKVYSAKYWTSGDLPDNPVLQAAETPWTLIGPVLPGEKPVPVVTAPAGTYPGWDAEKTYEKGDRILFDGHVFEAKWWNRSDSPEAALQTSDASPWRKFSNDEVQDVLEELEP
ncbi:glycosyl hydrolase family 18 protein [Arthrobacter sp. EH-1B-1]|uniref:Glycosyl hydrolase family 18 protein n=1 Tax=Arthrobacter vasquezii TaxID=2977629 RepID=A0ABT6CWS9_9MICC|nr:carbohydrate-binding protein [Arthrobacter vasquezii]MDF9277962.1 glycosyl hydrolase family 18 protein [Arthrobacter vasquezii]